MDSRPAIHATIPSTSDDDDAPSEGGHPGTGRDAHRRTAGSAFIQRPAGVARSIRRSAPQTTSHPIRVGSVASEIEMREWVWEWQWVWEWVWVCMSVGVGVNIMGPRPLLVELHM